MSNNLAVSSFRSYDGPPSGPIQSDGEHIPPFSLDQEMVSPSRHAQAASSSLAIESIDFTLAGSAASVVLSSAPGIKHDWSYCSEYIVRIRDSYQRDGHRRFPLETKKTASTRYVTLENGKDLKSAQSVFNKAIFYYTLEFARKQCNPLAPIRLNNDGIVLRTRPLTPTTVDNIVEKVKPFFLHQSPEEKIGGELVSEDLDSFEFDLLHACLIGNEFKAKPNEEEDQPQVDPFPTRNSSIANKVIGEICDFILDDLFEGTVHDLSSIDNKKVARDLARSLMADLYPT